MGKFGTINIYVYELESTYNFQNSSLVGKGSRSMNELTFLKINNHISTLL